MLRANTKRLAVGNRLSGVMGRDLPYKQFVFDNWDANPTLVGTAITPGASNAEGTFTQIASAANLSQDIFGIHLKVYGSAVGTQARNQLLDIGVDAAGGTSYTAVISNIVMGSLGGTTSAANGHSFFFPFFIAKGSSVAVRIQGSHATAGTTDVAMRFYGQVVNPETFPRGRYSQTMGTITNSNGTGFTPGTSADGTWVSLGTTTTELWWWQLAYQIDNGTIGAEGTYVDIGFGAGGSQTRLQRVMHVGTTSEAIGSFIDTRQNWFEAYMPLPAGTELWIRGRHNGAPVTGWNGVAIGIGG